MGHWVITGITNPVSNLKNPLDVMSSEYFQLGSWTNSFILQEVFHSAVIFVVV